MNKPQIIGCKPNPDATDAQRRRREQFIYYEVNAGGFWMESRHTSTTIHYTETARIKVNMFALGLRPVYAARDCHATPVLGGYVLHCRRCGCKWSTYRLPHNSATTHKAYGCPYVQTGDNDG